jgi:hypothetical protein
MRAATYRRDVADMKLLTPITFTAALAAVAGLAITVGVGSAANSGPSSFQPIVPCRLTDTRPASQVGPLGAPIGPDTAVTVTVHGANGNCTIPTTAVGIATNTTAVNPTAASFLTVYPADAATRPTASNLNYVPGSPPTPNQVTVGLSVDGKINVYNRFGSVDVVIDVVGYYVPASGGPAAPALHVATAPNVALAQPGGEQTQVVTVDVPAGRYHATYTVGVVNFTTNGDFHRCWLEAGGVEFLGLTTAEVGRGANVATLTGQADITVAAPMGTLALVCAHDNNRFSTNSSTLLYVENATVSALAVAS